VARRTLPDPLKRRHLLEEALEPARARAIADAYLEAGRTAEAVPFLHKADDRERLEALRDGALEAGDVFLLRSASQALGETPSAAVWARVAEAADAAGKERYAVEARRLAERS